MPKPHLREDFSDIETLLIKTFINGLHEWRPDLSYPESYSDLQGGMRAIMRKFSITVRQEPFTDEDMEENDL